MGCRPVRISEEDRRTTDQNHLRRNTRTDLITPESTTTVVDDPKRPWKALVAILIPVAITVVQLVQSGLNDGAWTSEDTFVVVLAVLGAAGVYLAPNPKVVERGNGL